MTHKRIVGTAGHIDHGKTSLVKALTGIDTDRLPEEKRRGITIDLGFANLQIGQFQIGLIDVPGHERFVKNMLAGVGGIDAALLVVAADESIKPQTREHFAICRLLQIPTGVVAITKSDLVEPEILDLVRMEVDDLVRGSFLEGRPVVATSAAAGRGLDALREALQQVLEPTAERDSADHVFRLPIDRVFTLKGFGTVITGTTVSGQLQQDSELELLPSGERTRARSLQVHGASRSTASAGERTSINLADLPLERAHRGEIVAVPGTLQPSSVVTAEMEMLPDAAPLKDQTRIRFHHFSAELLGVVHLLDSTRKVIAPGEKAWVQIRLESPVVAVSGDRFVIRRYSPPTTIGGGQVIDAHLGKLRRGTRKEILQALAEERIAARVPVLARLMGARGIGLRDLARRTGMTIEALQRELSGAPVPGTIAVGSGAETRWIAEESVRKLRERAMDLISTFFQQNRTAIGMPKGELLQKLRLADLPPVLIEIYLRDLSNERIVEISGDLLSVPGRKGLGGAEGELARTLEETFRKAGLQPPSIAELIKQIQQKPKVIEGVVGYLTKSAVLVRLADNVYLHRDVLKSAQEKLDPHRGKSVDVGWFKDLYSVSRKIVIPLLEHFDRAGVTRRAGDKRQIL